MKIDCSSLEAETCGGIRERERGGMGVEGRASALPLTLFLIHAGRPVDSGRSPYTLIYNRLRNEDSQDQPVLCMAADTPLMLRKMASRRVSCSASSVLAR